MGFKVVAKKRKRRKFSATEFYTSLLTHNDGSQEVGSNLGDNRK